MREKRCFENADAMFTAIKWSEIVPGHQSKEAALEEWRSLGKAYSEGSLAGMRLELLRDEKESPAAPALKRKTDKAESDMKTGGPKRGAQQVMMKPAKRGKSASCAKGSVPQVESQAASAVVDCGGDTRPSDGGTSGGDADSSGGSCAAAGASASLLQQLKEAHDRIAARLLAMRDTELGLAEQTIMGGKRDKGSCEDKKAVRKRCMRTVRKMTIEQLGRIESELGVAVDEGKKCRLCGEGTAVRPWKVIKDKQTGAFLPNGSRCKPCTWACEVEGYPPESSWTPEKKHQLIKLSGDWPGWDDYNASLCVD